MISKCLTGKTTGKRPLGRPMRRWEDNIRMDIKEIGINTRELGWFGSGYGLLECPRHSGIEPPRGVRRNINSTGHTNQVLVLRFKINLEKSKYIKISRNNELQTIREMDSNWRRCFWESAGIYIFWFIIKIK